MSSREVLERRTRWPDAVVRYADHEDGIIDIHLPPSRSGAHPVVVLLHGGFWRAEWDRRHTRPMAEDLASRGWIVATPEYRRTGDGGGWPATFDDVALATRRVPGLLGDLGVRAGAVRMVGHSAGGHLAMWVASQGLEIGRSLALAPVADLAASYRLDLDNGATAALLGGGPGDVPDRYRAADPMECLSSAPEGSVHIVHGTDDELVPIALSRAAASAHPDVVTLTELEGVDHFAVIDPTSAAWARVLDALDSD